MTSIFVDEKDQGPGNEDHFPAEDLERLYRQGGVDVAARIRGDQLNDVLGVTKYVKSAWYVVTADGVEKL